MDELSLANSTQTISPRVSLDSWSEEVLDSLSVALACIQKGVTPTHLSSGAKENSLIEQ